jgi:hypothetical protein
MLQDVSKLLQPGVLGAIYPDLAGMTPDIAGFGWFQGWNDGAKQKCISAVALVDNFLFLIRFLLMVGCSVNYTAAYETNLVHLIQDLRHAWKKPHLPVVIAFQDLMDGKTKVRVERHRTAGMVPTLPKSIVDVLDKIASAAESISCCLKSALQI